MARVQIPFAFQRVSSSGAIVAAASASVAILNRNTNGTSGTSATVYGTPTGGATSNPATTDADGRVTVWVDPGPYNLEVTAGTQSYTVAWDASSASTTPGHIVANGTDSFARRLKLQFVGPAVAVEDDDGGDQTVVTVSAMTTVQEEGSSLPAHSTINFVGNGVTATDGTGKTQVAVPGLTVKEGGVALPFQNALNFTGTGVDVSDGTGQTTVDISPKYQTVRYSGSNMAQQPTLEVAGSPVNVTNDVVNSRTKIQVNALTSLAVKKDSTTVNTVTDTGALQFTGGGVSLTDAGSSVTIIDIPAPPGLDFEDTFATDGGFYEGDITALTIASGATFTGPVTALVIDSLAAQGESFLALHTGSSVASLQAGLVFRAQSKDNLLLVKVLSNGTLQAFKIVGGVATQIGSDVTSSSLSTTTDYWLRGWATGDKVGIELYNALPDFGVAPLASASWTLPAVAGFGPMARGEAGFYIVPSTGLSLSEFSAHD
jgi:hypothetical protein